MTNDLADAYADALAGATTVRLADVEPEKVNWLWPARLPAGKLVILDGDPGVGKSTLAVDIAARVSTGREWPDGAPCPTGGVLILSAEDGLGDTIRPRLDAAAGDPTRVHALTEIRYPGEDGQLRARPPTLADVDELEEAVARTGARLVIIDVLMAYLPGGTDSHRDQDVRGVLHRLADLAERTGCTILLLRHLNKTSGGSPLYRGGGSIGIIGAARAALLAAPDPEDDSRRVLAVIKSNLGPMPPALGYRLADNPEHGCAHVNWLGSTGHVAADLLRRPDDGERSEQDEAAGWLLDYLAARGGEVPAAEVLKAGRAAGYERHTLQRERKRAPGVDTCKASFGAGWVWALTPEDDAKVTKIAAPEDLSPSSPSGVSCHLREGDGTAAGIPGPAPTAKAAGPCAGCGAGTARYGPGGSPLCADCGAKS